LRIVELYNVLSFISFQQIIGKIASTRVDQISSMMDSYF